MAKAKVNTVAVGMGIEGTPIEGILIAAMRKRVRGQEVVDRVLGLLALSPGRLRHLLAIPRLRLLQRQVLRRLRRQQHRQMPGRRGLRLDQRRLIPVLLGKRLPRLPSRLVLRRGRNARAGGQATESV